MSFRVDIAKIYVGYFGRSPEPEGFQYWLDEADRGFTLPEIAASFSVQPESTSQYPYLANPIEEDPEAFVISVYQNLFNRDPDDEGLEFWVNELNEAQGRPIAVGAMVLNIISGAQNTEEFGPDLDIINNKVEVALDWVDSMTEIDNFTYDDAAAASAKSVLDEVDETEESVEEGKEETREFAENYEGRTFTLTSDVDSGPDFVGTNVADTYNAVAQTLNTGDDLDGGDGNDTLSVLFGNFQSVSATPRLSNIENIEVQGGARDLNASIDLTTSTGVEKIMLQDVNGESTQNFDFNARVLFEGVENIVEIAIADSSTPDATFSTPPLTELIVRYDTAATAGEGDVQKLSISNSGVSTFDVAGLTTLEITAEGRNFVKQFDQFSEITVDGAGDLVAGFTSTDTTATFSSLTSTGNMAISFANGQNVDIEAGEGDDNFDLSSTAVVDAHGGAGEDIFFFDSGAGSLTADDNVDGGDDKDTVAIDNLNSVSTEVLNGLTSIEALQFQSQNDRMVASDFDDIDEFVHNGANNNRRSSIDGVESDDLFVFTADRSAADKTLRFEGENVGETLTMELRALSDGSLTKDFQTVTNGQVEIRATSGTGDDTSAVYLASNIASVTIASTGSNTNANLIDAADSGDNHYAFDNESTSNFTIIGDQDLTIAAREGVDQSGSSDVMGFSRAANVDASDFNGDLRIAMSNGSDVIVGGNGNDIIYTRGGDDVVSGGDGADQFRYTGNNGTDEILDFLISEDKIGLSEVDFANTTESFAGTTLDADDYVENRNSIDNIGTADAFSLIELGTALSTGQIENDTGAAVQAYVLVFNSTTQKGEIWHDNNWSDAGNRDHVATLDNVVDLAGVQAFSNTDFVEFIA